MRHIRPTVMAAITVLLTLPPAAANAQDAFRRGGGATGFTTNALPHTDDWSSPSPVAIGFDIDFFGTTYSQLYVNNNGNVTLNGPLLIHNPFSMTGATGNPILAAFFADIDTESDGSAVATYGQGTVDGRAAFGVNFDGVGYYAARADKLNIFQLLLIDRNDISSGDFDIEFNYDRILWETSDANGGLDGLGGMSAIVGYSSGAGTADSHYQLPGSEVTGALLDGGANALISNSRNSTVDGRYIFQVRNGVVQPPTSVVPEPSTILLTATGLLGLAAVGRLRRRTER